MGDERPEVRSPSAEVIVYVDRRNAETPRGSPQPMNPPGHGKCRGEHAIALGEGKIVDGVYDEHHG